MFGDMFRQLENNRECVKTYSDIIKNVKKMSRHIQTLLRKLRICQN